MATPICGIYAIRNVVDGKTYVGSSVSVRRRWSEHRTRLRGGTHDNNRLQKAWSRHGESSFAFEVVVVCSRDRLVPEEERALGSIPVDLRYNLGRCTVSPTLGRVVPDEQRIRQSRTRGQRPVVAVNLTTGEHRHYEALSFAVRDGFDRSSIQQTVDGKLSQHAGWGWFREGEVPDVLPPPRDGHAKSRCQGGRPVVGVSVETGEEIALDYIGQCRARGWLPQSIHACLRGNLRTAYGHAWFFADAPRGPMPARWGNAAKGHGRAVVGVKVGTGDEVRFSCLNDARAAGFNTGAITNNIAGLSKTSQGYVWRYEEPT